MRPIIRFFHYDRSWYEGSGQCIVQICVISVKISIIGGTPKRGRGTDFIEEQQLNKNSAKKTFRDIVAIPVCNGYRFTIDPALM